MPEHKFQIQNKTQNQILQAFGIGILNLFGFCNLVFVL